MSLGRAYRLRPATRNFSEHFRLLRDKMVKPTHALFATTMVGLNLMIGFIVKTASLPVFLDSIGIVLTGILAGPLLAVIVGVATTVLGSTIIFSGFWAFSGTAAVIGLLSGWLAKRGFFTQFWKVLVAGLIIGVAAAIVSAPVKAFMFGGVTTSGSDWLTLLYRQAGGSIADAVLKAGLTNEPIDKTIVCFSAWFIGRSLSRRTLQWFPGAAERLGRTAPAE